MMKQLIFQTLHTPQMLSRFLPKTWLNVTLLLITLSEGYSLFTDGKVSEIFEWGLDTLICIQFLKRDASHFIVNLKPWETMSLVVYVKSTISHITLHIVV